MYGIKGSISSCLSLGKLVFFLLIAYYSHCCKFLMGNSNLPPHALTNELMTISDHSKQMQQAWLIRVVCHIIIHGFKFQPCALQIWRIFQNLGEYVSSTYPVLPSNIWIILRLQRTGILWIDRKFYNSLQLRWTEIYWPIITPSIVFPWNFSKCQK